MKVQDRKPSFKFMALIFFFGLLAIGAMSIVQQNAQASTSDEARLMLVPPKHAQVGEVIRVELVATNVHNLAGFQGTIRIDPDSLRITGAQIDHDLTRSGRDLLPLGPVLHSDAVMLGAATCPVENCNQSSLESVRRASKGVDGQVTLATIELHTNLPGTHQLRLEDVELVDPQGEPLPVKANNSVLTVGER